MLTAHRCRRTPELYFALASLLAVSALWSSRASAQSPIINEFVANHTGIDTFEFIEVFGPPNTDLSHLTILEIEGDSSTGVIDDAFPVGTTNADGFWVTAFLTNRIENGTQTLLLVEGFFGAVGDDIDANDDGIADNTPWTKVVDSVGVTDGGSSDSNYLTQTILDNTLPPSPFTPGGASRIPNGVDTDTVADWLRNDFDGEGLPILFVGMLDLHEARNTPGMPNTGLPDTDGDGTPDGFENCPNDPNKLDPGQCGCGNPDTDSDSDGVADCNDNCPSDAAKLDPGFCGCGVADEDLNANSIPDCLEQAPAGQPTGDCGCDGGMGGMMVMPMTLVGIGWMRRRRRRARRPLRQLPQHL